MGDQRHVIKRQIIELTVQRQEEAHLLQAEVSRVYRQRIVPLIEQYCSALSAPDRIHRLERLEIDLGQLTSGQIETDLMARTSSALYEALAMEIREQEERAQQQGDSLQAASHLETFATFAHTGALPWWADLSQPRLLEECLQTLLDQTPQQLRHLMRELVRQPPALQRIIHYYADEMLARLAALLVPSLGHVFMRDHQGLVAILHKSRAAANRQPKQLAQSIWGNLFLVAAAHGDRSAAPESFYRAFLARLSKDLGLPYDAFVAELDRGFSESSDHDAAGIEAFIGRATSSPQTDSALAELRELLQTLAPQLSVSTRNQLVSALEELERGSPSPEAVQAILERLRHEQASDLPTERGSATRSTVAVADELYIGNAGLVILWPFLSHFFSRLGLLVEKQFKDSAAMQRGVGLLQHLATAEHSFPEYLLPLNKVLCGMEWVELFDFGPPLTTGEVEECTDLLNAVIAQAPILRQMSVEGFRSTFLLRPGVLRARDGAWLLQVERETYDIVLDRFPWSWEWVKLPWMETPLRVEW
jgi:hypothetical protein